MAPEPLANIPLLIPCAADPSRVQPFVVHPLTTAEQCAQAALELQNLDQVRANKSILEKQNNFISIKIVFGEKQNLNIVPRQF